MNGTMSKYCIFDADNTVARKTQKCKIVKFCFDVNHCAIEKQSSL